MPEPYCKRGFLPAQDPAREFERYPQLEILQHWGHQLPQRLMDPNFRQQAREWKIPFWPGSEINDEVLPEIRLYYVHLGFIASGYINQIGQPECHNLPANIAQPLIHCCQKLGRPPMLSYDGYALYNWYRMDPKKPIELGNIDTIQNFVDLYDEHWFILIHIAIEAEASRLLKAILTMDTSSTQSINKTLHRVEDSLKQQTALLKRIPENMSANLYFDHFRPYIRFFNQVTYEGKIHQEHNYRGESGAQSSIFPALTAFMKIPHEATPLIYHLNDMRQYMPLSHHFLLEKIEAMPNIKNLASPVLFNHVLEAMAQFREQHYQWAMQYIADKTEDPQGTGGTPYQQWLQQLIVETRQYKVKAKMVKHTSLEIIQGDITQLDVNAIVRPAHRNLHKGRGVSQIIFSQAGEGLIQACEKLPKCQPGQAVITSAFDLPCDAVIHTVPPHWSGGDQWATQSLDLLKDCYEASIQLALDNGVDSLAFVSLGTGANQFPHAIAAHQALEVLMKYQHRFQRLVVCLSRPSSYATWMDVYKKYNFIQAA